MFFAEAAWAAVFILSLVTLFQSKNPPCSTCFLSWTTPIFPRSIRILVIDIWVKMAATVGGLILELEGGIPTPLGQPAPELESELASDSIQEVKFDRRGSGLSRRQRKNCRKKGNRSTSKNGGAGTGCGIKKNSGPPCRTYKLLSMSDQQIYYWIYSYCLDLIRLRRLGFPLESELHPGSAVVYVDPDFCFDEEEEVTSSTTPAILDVNAREFIPRAAKSSDEDEERPLNAAAKEFIPSGSGSSNDESVREMRNCARCGRSYCVDATTGEHLTREKCHYHWGKPQGVDAYTCCNGLSSRGCVTAKAHVWRGRLFQTAGMHGPFKNFVRTKGRKNNPANGYHGVYALDGEMCYTTRGMELIRLSVVGIDGRPVYDTLVLPENPVVDYNTRFSGLTDRDLRDNPRVKSLRNVQNDLMGFITSSTILIGHGLENDFRALRLVHTLVVDTSVLYSHYYGLPYRRSLKSLARSYLKQEIQSERGHDSFEDARASLELVLCKVKAEVASTVKNSNPSAAVGLVSRPAAFPSMHFGGQCNNELVTNSKLRLKQEEDVDPNYWQH